MIFNPMSVLTPNEDLVRVKTVVVWILSIYFILAFLSLFFFEEFFYGFNSSRIGLILLCTFLTLIVLKAVNLNFPDSNVVFTDVALWSALIIFLLLFFSFTSLTFSSLTGNYRDEVSARSSVTQYLSVLFSLLVVVSRRNYQIRVVFVISILISVVFMVNADRMSFLTFLPAFLLCYLKCGFRLRLRYFMLGGFVLLAIQSLRIGSDINVGLNSFYLLLANPRDTLFSSYLVSEVVSKCGGDRLDYLFSWLIHIFSVFSDKPSYITDTYECNDIPGGGFSAGYYFMFFGDWFILMMPVLTYFLLKIPSVFNGYERSFLSLVIMCSLVRYFYYGPVAMPKYLLVGVIVVILMRFFIRRN